MFGRFDWTIHLINICKQNYISDNTCGKICFDFFFSSCNHKFYILIVTRLFKVFDYPTTKCGKRSMKKVLFGKACKPTLMWCLHL